MLGSERPKEQQFLRQALRVICGLEYRRRQSLVTLFPPMSKANPFVRKNIRLGQSAPSSRLYIDCKAELASTPRRLPFVKGDDALVSV